MANLWILRSVDNLSSVRNLLCFGRLEFRQCHLLGGILEQHVGRHHI